MLCSNDLLKELKDSNIFIDTNVLIGALFLKDLRDFLYDLKRNGCAFLSIPAVAVEFYRGSKRLSENIIVKDSSPTGYKRRADFYNKIVDTTFQIDQYLDKMEDFIVVAHNTSSNMEFPDITLSACLYHFKHIKPYLMTSNIKHFSSSIFKREFVLTPESGKDIMNYCIYSLSIENYKKASQNILKMKSDTPIKRIQEELEEDVPF
jgi:predicted nucleic acid-binding protein